MTEEEARQEAVYASLDWDTNPPINGFYESMMALGVEGRARLRQRIREQKATQPELFYTQEDTPKTQAQERRPQHDTGVRPAYPVENGFEAEARKRIDEVERQMQEEEASLPPEELERRRREEMQPRPFTGVMEPHLKEGALVRVDTAGVRYQVGVLKDVTRYGATFQPLDLQGYQKEKAALYIQVRDSYERLYAYEAENREEHRQHRENLNTHYDEFVMRYGNLNARQNGENDPDGCRRQGCPLAGAWRKRSFRQGGHLRPSRVIFAGGECQRGDTGKMRLPPRSTSTAA